MLWLALFWLLYFSLHSLLASAKLKALVQRRFPAVARAYRLLYNLIAASGLLALLLYQGQLDTPALWAVGWGIGALGFAFLLTGAGLGRKALQSYDLSAFAGTRQLNDEQIDPSEPLSTQGLNQYMRHPLYAATILLLIGGLLLRPTQAMLLTVAMALLYLRVGIHWEEAKLLDRYGEAYRQYRQAVPMLWPRGQALFR